MGAPVVGLVLLALILSGLRWTKVKIPTSGFTQPMAVGLALAVVTQVVVAGMVERGWISAYMQKVLADIGINVILAVSLNLVNGFTGQFSIGHAGFMAVGGYVAGVITYYGGMLLWGTTLPHGGFLGSGEWLFVAGCLVGGLVAAITGYLVGLPSLRLRGDYLAIVTLGFGEIVRVLLQQTDDVLTEPADVAATPKLALFKHVGGSLGFSGITGLPTYTSLFWVFAFVALILVVSYRLKVSSYGRALLSVRENEIAAEAMGVNTTKFKVRAFILAAFFAGIGGGLFGHEVGTTLNPRELGFQKSFDLVIMVVLGGMGSISGATLAAILLTVLPELLRSFSDYRLIVYALTLIVMMIVRPQGLFGIHEIWELPWVRRLAGKKPPPAAEARA